MSLKKPLTLRRRRRLLLGVPPGTLPELAQAPKPRVRVLAYGPRNFEEKELDNIGLIREFKEHWPVVRVNVDGLGDTALIQQLGEMFNLHALSLEDVLTLNQRPKVEQYNEYLFMVLRMMEPGDTSDTEQIGLFTGEGFVLTFQEHVGDCFEPVRKRIRESKGRLRTAGADYLSYSLLDAIVDSYFPQFDSFSERLEQLEDEILFRPTTESAAKLHHLKQELSTLRRIIWPSREAVNALLRGSGPFLSDVTRVYLRDCYDHLIEISDMIDTFRDLTTSLLDVYLSSVSNRMNEIMKVLTIISTVFIPLTFVAGVYGMNFSYDSSPYNMPELHSRWGYPTVVLVMTLIAALELLLFWRKGWIGGSGVIRKPRKRRRRRGDPAQSPTTMESTAASVGNKGEPR